MFLDVTVRRNAGLIRAAIELHQGGQIPPDTFLIDLETVQDNARSIVEAAQRRGIRLYGMTKQHGRNPLLARAMLATGIGKAVAVEFEEARTLHAQGIPIGHLGHLVQVPRSSIPAALAMTPEVVTVYSQDKARQIGALARGLGVVQPLLLRVIGEGDFFFHAQEGGFLLDSLADAARAIQRIEGVRVEGVTSHPCVVFDDARGEAVAGPNLHTLTRGAEILRAALGAPVAQVNAPGMTACASMAILQAAGATHGEPGSSLSGHTPLHAIRDEPERPAMVYVSEVSHRLRERIFAFGGGLYPRSRMKAAIVARTPDAAFAVPPLPAVPRLPEAIDYHGELRGSSTDDHRVGDTVVYAFRSQVFVARSHVAVAAGITQNRPRLLGLFDHLGRLTDPASGYPLGQADAQTALDRAWADFSRTQQPRPATAAAPS